MYNITVQYSLQLYYLLVQASPQYVRETTTFGKVCSQGGGGKFPPLTFWLKDKGHGKKENKKVISFAF